MKPVPAAPTSPNHRAVQSHRHRSESGVYRSVDGQPDSLTAAVQAATQGQARTGGEPPLLTAAPPELASLKVRRSASVVNVGSYINGACYSLGDQQTKAYHGTIWLLVVDLFVSGHFHDPTAGCSCASSARGMTPRNGSHSRCCCHCVLHTLHTFSLQTAEGGTGGSAVDWSAPPCATLP